MVCVIFPGMVRLFTFSRFPHVGPTLRTAAPNHQSNPRRSLQDDILHGPPSRHLHLYTNQAVINEILDNTNSGGVTVNDFLMDAAVSNAPFGGVGKSGYGSYLGIYGFLAFSHKRIVLQMPTWLDSAMGFRYLPYDMKDLGKIKVENKLGFK